MQAAYSARLLRLKVPQIAARGVKRTPEGPEIKRTEGLSTLAKGVRPLNLESTCTLRLTPTSETHSRFRVVDSFTARRQRSALA